jgi:hypothetical protein
MSQSTLTCRLEMGGEISLRLTPNEDNPSDIGPNVTYINDVPRSSVKAVPRSLIVMWSF